MYGNGKNTFYRLQATVQREFAHDNIFIQLGGRKLFIGSQNADSDRQVIRRTFFFHVSGGHVDDYPFARYL